VIGFTDEWGFCDSNSPLEKKSISSDDIFTLKIVTIYTYTSHFCTPRQTDKIGNTTYRHMPVCHLTIRHSRFAIVSLPFEPVRHG